MTAEKDDETAVPKSGPERGDDDKAHRRDASTPDVVPLTDHDEADDETTEAAVPSARARERDRRRKAQRDRGERDEALAAAASRRNVERGAMAVGGALIVGLAVFLAVNGGRGAKSGDAADGAAEAQTALTAAKLDPASALLAVGDLDGGAPGADDLLGAGGAGSGGRGQQPDYRNGQSGVGSRLPDGSPVPPLPDKAPRSVRFGVVLVTYAGAQGAPANARAKKDAEELAQKLAGDAKADFHGTVAHGDPGSADDAGRIPRGVLELAPEYILFTLPPGGVSDPVDTPRGYWIVKRTE